VAGIAGIGTQSRNILRRRKNQDFHGGHLHDENMLYLTKNGEIKPTYFVYGFIKSDYLLRGGILKVLA
jgi:hypothetical protein